MKIGVDLRVLASGSETGVQQYTVGLLKALTGQDKKNQYKFFYNAKKKANLNFSWIAQENCELFSFDWPNRILDLSLGVLGRPFLDEKIKGCDIYFVPHFLRVATKNARRILTFHDLSFEYHPEFFSSKHRIWHQAAGPKKRAQEADQIIAVSESTKSDLVNLYKISPDKVKVIYSGIEKDFFNKKISDKEILKIKKRYDLPQKFVLYFGTIEPRKNIEGLITAFEILRQNKEYRNLHLVLAGSFGWLYQQILSQVKKSKFAEFIHFTGFVKNNDKAILYRLAKLFVYPSFFEGFGFPPLEAMACRVPVICSNKTSLPEVVGDAALMIDPYIQSELAEAMKLVLKEEDFAQELARKGTIRAKKFSWDRTAKQFLNTINNL